MRQKAIPDRIRNLFRRILGEVNDLIPREGDPIVTEQEIDEARSQATQENARRLIERYQQTQFNPAAERIADRFYNGEISGTVARGLMIVEIRALLITAAAAAAGGIGALTPFDRARIEAGVQEQARYLDNWIAQAEREPKERRSQARFRNRARQYGGAGGRMVDETIDKNRFREFPDLPFHAKERCICRNGCACGWMWTNVDRKNGNAEVIWKLNYTRTAKEHCLTCLLRASTFNPLVIRNWNFVNLPSDLTPYLTER